ncbi:hypothetical protein FHG87_008352 [Trinorchestia longiramus]|nr:hypothetical protein FHG87_008352 [Trinorchestia longiramus]
MARTGVMGVSSPLWTRVGVMLVITSWGGGVGGVGGGWFCDFSKSEVPKYKDVMLEALKNYKANSNAKFYPMTSVYREMLDTMNCVSNRRELCNRYGML